MQLSQKQNIFWQCFPGFLKSWLHFEQIQNKRIHSWLMYFQNCGLWKIRLVKCLKSAASQYLLTSNMVNLPKHCWNLNGCTVILIYWLLRIQLSLKKALLMICKILKLFVETFTTYDKYSVLNRVYLTYPIHMHLSKKQKTF